MVNKKYLWFIAMFIGSGLVGLAVGVVAVLIGAAVMRDELFGLGGLIGGLWGVFLGYPIGVVTGIFLLKRFVHYQGSVIYGLIGCLIAAGISVGMIGPLNIDINPSILFSIFFISCPLLATTGFYLGKKRKKTSVGKKNGGDGRIRTAE